MSAPVYTTAGSPPIDLFDKQINLKLYYRNFALAPVSPGAPIPEDYTQFDTITIPTTGVKPKISLHGSMIGDSTIAKGMQLRIWNFFSNLPLSAYKFIGIEAGYKNQLDTSVTGSDNKGQVWTAYQEKPSPDGVTQFDFQVCQYSSYINGVMEVKKYAPTDSVNTVLRDCAKACRFNFRSTIPDTALLGMDFDTNAPVNSVLQRLQQSYRFNYRVDGGTILFWDFYGDSGIEYTISYLSSPPQLTAAGITFIAPWIPNIRCGDRIHIDPRFMRQTYASQHTNISTTHTFVVNTLDFAFDTVTNENAMTIFALNTGGNPA